MNQIKPYLFWVVSGVALVVILILAAIFAPSGTWAGNTVDAYGAKTALDDQARKFKDLVKRVGNGNPILLFDPVIRTDIERLTNDYLLTEEWEPVIRKHVDDYSKQLQSLRSDLVNRSRVLHEPISSSSALLAWYTAYQEKTGTFVASLRDAGCLVLPKLPNSGRSAGAPVGAGSGDEDPMDPATGAKIRTIVGLFTRISEYPPQEQHAQLRVRFRIVEAIGRIVMASGVDTEPNPIVDPTGRVATPAAIAAIEWGNDTKNLEGVTGTFATYIRLKLTLHGTESALLAALAGLESLDKPIAIVVASTLSRQERLSAGERLIGTGADFRAATAILNVDLLVLDYSQMPDPTAENMKALEQPQAGMPFGGASGDTFAQPIDPGPEEVPQPDMTNGEEQ